MLLSSRSSDSVRPWRTLLATLAFTTAAVHAQEQTARLVKDANATKQGLYSDIQWVEPVGTGVVFPMDTLANGTELWYSDGTAKGTKLLKDIVPGLGSSGPRQGTVFGTGASAKVAFLTQPASWVAADAANPPELDLWVTDGTAAGTVRIFESAFPDVPGDTSLRAGTTNGVFLEDAGYSEDGPELFFSDGTTAGTHSLNPLVGEVRKFEDPKNFITSGAWCYFIANQKEIWRSDGTTAGTTKVATFTDVTPDLTVVAGSDLYISVVQTGSTYALWKVPAAGGTPVRVGPPDGTTWRAIAAMQPAGSKVALVTVDQANKPLLWTTDGTTAGTQRIPLALPGQSTESTVGYALTKWQDAVYFATIQSGVASGLWRTDGTAAGTTLLKTVKAPFGIGDGMLPGTDGFYFFTSTEKGLQLWRSQGTTASTVTLKGTPLISYAMPYAPIITPTASTVYMLSGQATVQEALVRMKNAKGGSLQLTRPETTNATGVPAHAIGTPPYQIRNGSILSFVNTSRGQEMWQINPDNGKSKSVFKLTFALKSGGTIGFNATTPAGELFTRYGGDALCQVFVTNGAARGTTVLAEDKNAGGFSFAKAGDTTYFSPDYPLTSLASTITKTDGTAAGTTVIKTTDSATPKRLGNIVPFQGALYFISPSADGKKQALWKTDGTPAGTVLVANTWYGDATESITNLSAAGGKLYFAIGHNSKYHIWQSDGTAAGTSEVNPANTFIALSSPAIDLAGKALIVARPESTDDPQWWSIANGTFTRIQSPPVAYANSTAAGFPSAAVAGSQLFFTAGLESDGEIWVTNGTTAGTHLVKDINPGPEGSWPSSMLGVGNYVYFIASNPDSGRELWRSDGTQIGTVLAADVEPGPNSSVPHGLKAMDGRLYFNAFRRTTGRELYSVSMPTQ